MASIKLALPVALLLCGFMAIGGMLSTEAKRGEVCAMYCEDAKYMTCPGSEQQQPAACINCCLAPKKGCTIYLNDGGVKECS